VVMVSSLTQVGADVTFAALELGAVDFLPKPAGSRVADIKAMGETLVAKVLEAARSRVRNPHPAASRPKPPASRPSRASRPGLAFVVIGISTGGPQALGETLPLLTTPIPPVLIVQHMPAPFTDAFAQRLNRACSVAVKEAQEGDPILPDQILIAPGGRHMLVTGQPNQSTVSLTDGPLVSGHRPSIDMLFQSAARLFGAATVAIIMTGMGRDGVEGCKRILNAGGTTFGQDEATSVVYGMNKAAFLEGAVRAQFPLEKLPALIEQWART
jgi:two-component system chemotaxis response regulator CheB